MLSEIMFPILFSYPLLSKNIPNAFGNYNSNSVYNLDYNISTYECTSANQIPSKFKNIILIFIKMRIIPTAFSHTNQNIY